MVHKTIWWKKILAIRSFSGGIKEDDPDYLYSDNSNTVHLIDNIKASKAPFIISFREKNYGCHQNSTVPVFQINENLTCNLVNGNLNLSPAEISFLQLYLPYALMPYYARKKNKPFTVSHLTQSLDGKIATCSGHSKWIGNEEDLIHTHCMRSLCDAIIIGNNTIKNDEPKLTVRNVEGPSPVKMIIGNTKSNLESLLSDIEQPLISFSNKSLYENDDRVQEIIFPGNYISSVDVLNHLASNGICSVFIEGGAQTVSCFLKENNIDSFQIHISNKILGSGISAISLDAIETIGESISLKNTKHYHLGEEILLVANI
jgi:diaminohydroxyphosphoribosylaminopyrimidine deaminase / 5-amino-6-(5-phosphoribosylamino)uracil reductase